jgi:hypothetical protein
MQDSKVGAAFASCNQNLQTLMDFGRAVRTRLFRLYKQIEKTDVYRQIG